MKKNDEPKREKRPQNPDLPYTKPTPHKPRNGELYDDPPCSLVNEGVASAQECTGLMRRDSVSEDEVNSLRAIYDVPPSC